MNRNLINRRQVGMIVSMLAAWTLSGIGAASLAGVVGWELRWPWVTLVSAGVLVIGYAALRFCRPFIDELNKMYTWSED